MAEDKRTVGGQPVIDNVPLKHEPNGASDFCMHCGVDLCGNDPRADQPCLGLESARRLQIDPASLVAFGCQHEADGGDRCKKWCQGVDCAYARGVAPSHGETLPRHTPAPDSVKEQKK